MTNQKTNSINIVKFDLRSGEEEIMASCQLNEKGTVTVTGDTQFIAGRLAGGVRGIKDGQPTILKPQDGQLYLDALWGNFNSNTLYATAAKNSELSNGSTNA